MRNLFYTITLALLMLLTGCINPPPTSADYCSSYQLQEIKHDDPLKVQLEKLEQNTAYQRLCR